jgi:hypothetical protein
MNDIEWDQSPEEATHYDLRYGFFCNQFGFYDSKGKYIQDEQVEWGSDRYVPRTSQLPAKWNGEGKPPIGTLCRYDRGFYQESRIVIDQWRDGDPLEVLAYREVEGRLLPVVYNTRHGSASCIVLSCLRPMKTEREKQIDAIEALICFAESTTTSAAERLYDAGARVRVKK